MEKISHRLKEAIYKRAHLGDVVLEKNTLNVHEALDFISKVKTQEWERHLIKDCISYCC